MTMFRKMKALAALAFALMVLAGSFAGAEPVAGFHRMGFASE